jgi:hypothetical protein
MEGTMKNDKQAVFIGWFLLLTILAVAVAFPIQVVAVAAVVYLIEKAIN